MPKRPWMKGSVDGYVAGENGCGWRTDMKRRGRNMNYCADVSMGMSRGEDVSCCDPTESFHTS